MILFESDGFSIAGTIMATDNNLVQLPSHWQYSAKAPGVQYSTSAWCFKEPYLMSSIEVSKAGQKSGEGYVQPEGQLAIRHIH
jgi:hypothetical protein